MLITVAREIKNCILNMNLNFRKEIYLGWGYKFGIIGVWMILKGLKITNEKYRWGAGGGPENQTMTHFNIQRVERDEAPEVCMEAFKTGSAGGTTQDTCAFF